MAPVPHLLGFDPPLQRGFRLMRQRLRLVWVRARQVPVRGDFLEDTWSLAGLSY
jgi:hypothetical protein